MVASEARFVAVGSEQTMKIVITDDSGNEYFVGFRPRGDYSGGEDYDPGDLVLNQNSSWLALQSTTGNAPPTLPTTSNAYWQLISKAGTSGVQSSDASVADILAMDADDYALLTPDATTIYFTFESE